MYISLKCLILTIIKNVYKLKVFNCRDNLLQENNYLRDII